MRRRTLLAGIVVAAVGGAVAVGHLVGGVGTVDDGTNALKPDDSAVVARGAAVYASRCAGCHGANLEGQPDWQQRRADGKLPAPPHDASGHTWHHWDAQLIQLVRDGLPKQIAGQPYLTDMPAFGDTLTNADIVAVLSFIKSQWPADVRERQDDLNSRFSAAAPR